MDDVRIWASDYKVRTYPSYMNDGAAVILTAKTYDGRKFRASLSWEEVKGDDFVFEPQPLFVLQRQQGQVMIDDLWAAGFRPTEAAGSAGAMAAAQDHIASLRKIAFKVLGVE